MNLSASEQAPATPEDNNNTQVEGSPKLSSSDAQSHLRAALLKLELLTEQKVRSISESSQNDDSLSEEIKSLKLENASYKEELNELRHVLDRYEKEAQKWREAEETNEEAQASYERQIEQLSEENAQLKEDNTQLEADKTQIEERYQSLGTQLSRLTQKVSEILAAEQASENAHGDGDTP